MSRRNNIWLNLDWMTVLIYLILIVLGWINIYAAVYDEAHQSIFDITQRYGKQLMWIFAGLALAFVVLILDSKFYVAFAYGFYALVIVLLVAVLFFGKEVNGARAWFSIGGFALQPAELGKFVTNLAVAKFISQYNFRMDRFKSLLGLGFLIGLPALLVIAQNDTGSALVYTVFVLVFYREGLSGSVLFFGFLAAVLFVLSLLWPPLNMLVFLVVLSVIALAISRQNSREVFSVIAILVVLSALTWLTRMLVNLEWSDYRILLIGVISSSVIFLFYALKRRIQAGFYIMALFVASMLFTTSVDFVLQNLLAMHQKNRIEELVGIRYDPYGTGYHVHQSKIAIGSGGAYGKGFLKGTQTKYNFVPEQSTDFIFCTVGEEWGFVGTTVVILLFITLFLRLLYLSERQRSTFSRVYGYGVAAILFFHFAVNIGMTIGLAPVIGIPLPFLSYGGSSLWAFTVMLFIFLRLDASRMEILH